jgi:hypothetical protein
VNTTHTALAGIVLAALTACAPAADPEPPAPCGAAPQELLDAIASGAESDVGTLQLTAGKTLRTGDTYLVAARIAGSGLDGTDVGVWATSDLQPGVGLLLAVDGFAKQLTVWPDADSSAADIGAGDPDVQAVASCSA